jgi:hypothetical protein
MNPGGNPYADLRMQLSARCAISDDPISFLAKFGEGLHAKREHFVRHPKARMAAATARKSPESRALSFSFRHRSFTAGSAAT